MDENLKIVQIIYRDEQSYNTYILYFLVLLCEKDDAIQSRLLHLSQLFVEKLVLCLYF